MTDDEWEKQRRSVVLAVFQTGRPVFADTDGELRFVDGAKELVPADVGVPKAPVPRARALAVRAERASHWAFVSTVIAAIANGIAAIWHPWHLALVVVFVGGAVVWRRVNQHQGAQLRADPQAEERRDG